MEQAVGNDPTELVYRAVAEGELDYALECHCRVCHSSNNFRGGRPSYDSFRARFVERGVWEQSRGHMLASLKDARTLLCVAESTAGARVGFFWVVFNDWYEEHWADINDIYVEETWRRRGVALRMLTWIKEQVAKRGAQVLISSTGVDNTISQALHNKFGFQARRFEYQIWLQP